ncbi:hypothetical protein NG895_05455 [Aeoliella sp. ICT_H6.2]|uniref:Uncharacterized protein n=1 Tax=Aeoliella straminimaris TaxID=2954799 RepID=A0A9X2JFI3_9BACT|nr:hypothetical protein [Aeoliella straminimaris]MCO6043347.1 hypothetical protein [Aeoliella straminimaris]
MSRLFPLGPIHEALVGADPREFDRPTTTGQRCVEIHTRKTKLEPAHPIPFEPDRFSEAEYAELLLAEKMLTLSNDVNSRFCLMGRKCYRTYDDGDEPTYHWLDGTYEVRSWLAARFTENLEGDGPLFHHGRIYTPGFSNLQGLCGAERATLLINGRPTVELDFGSLHAMLAYNLRGLPCPEDPYKLWGAFTTKAQRAVGKHLISSGWNVKGGWYSAIQSSAKAAQLNKHRPESYEVQGWDGDCLLGDAKGGATEKRKKEWHKARELRRALHGMAPQLDLDDRKALQHFLKEEVWPLVKKQHGAVLDLFGTDAGMRLFMPIDGAIARDVLHHFAKQGKPCFPIHDSFLVFAEDKQELCDVMHAAYRKIIGEYVREHVSEPEQVEFAPVVKDRNGMIVEPSRKLAAA